MLDTAVDEQLTVVRRRSPWQILGTVVALVLGAMLVHTLVVNQRFEWGVVAQYLTVDAIVSGALFTVELTAISMVLGVLLGILLAIMRISRTRLLSGISFAFVWFFRGTPLLIQLIFWFNLSALYPALSLGIPFGPAFISGSANAFITPFVAAVLGLTLNEAAYMAEIIRGGFSSVGKGQIEAADSLGMSAGMRMRKVIIPQAMPSIIPATGNQVIGMFKETSLVSVLGVAELLQSAQLIYARTYETIPLLIVAALWYLAMTTVLSIGQYYLERRYRRGDVGAGSARRPRVKPAGAVAEVTP